MIRLTKIFHFESAHALSQYTGKCKNIHGHSYELYVTISGIPEKNPKISTCGMVIDFGDLKKIVNQYIIDVLDHAIILNRDSFYFEIGNYLENKNHRVVYLKLEPTCENMLYKFSEIIQKHLPKNIILEKLKLFETKTSYGEWIRKDQ